MSDPPVLRLTLRDGHPVALRPVVPSDRDRLAAGFAQLSADSRRLRFLGSVSTLSDAHLRYLTEVDGHNHVAWGAIDLHEPDAPGFGVGRFVRLSEDPATAEFSLTVLDTAQDHGVGQLLLALLAVVAPRKGIRTLRGVVGRENERMTRWLRRLGATSAGSGQDLVMDLHLPIDPTVSDSAADFVETTEQIRRELDRAEQDG
jgi:GNAT superfamily N-acetyltransferase